MEEASSWPLLLGVYDDLELGIQIFCNELSMAGKL